MNSSIDNGSVMFPVMSSGVYGATGRAASETTTASTVGMQYDGYPVPMAVARPL
jgi:hypothetical protein